MNARSQAPLGAAALAALAASASFGGTDLFQDGRFTAAVGDYTSTLSDFAPFDDPGKLVEDSPYGSFNAHRSVSDGASPGAAYHAGAGQVSSFDPASLSLTARAWAYAAQSSDIGAPA